MDRLILCGSCTGGAGAALAADLADALPEGVVVEVADCLNVCDRPAAMALRGPGKDAYLFAGIGTDDAVDLASLVRMYAEAPAGRIEDARPAGRLRHCLLGRIPAG